MLDTNTSILENAQLEDAIRELVNRLGEGQIDGSVYDTAWVTRLAPLYPTMGFEDGLDWLRHHQHEDGTWGTRLPYYHDRYINTLAAIVALSEVGGASRDERRIKRGASALWRLVGRLQQDGEDTVGFPILSVVLSDVAHRYGLDVPHPPVRFGRAYKKRVTALMQQDFREWHKHPLTFSLDGLQSAIPSIRSDERVLEPNGSVAISPSATAAYLMHFQDDNALHYLREVVRQEPENLGMIPVASPLDVFEIAWSINHLIIAEAITPDDPAIRKLVDRLWELWSPEFGVSTSRFYSPHDADDTAATFNVLYWAGYPVSPDVFKYYEGDKFFQCYRDETHHSISANIRILHTLRQYCQDYPEYERWVEKIISGLMDHEDNGTFWWDKWHASPYYTNAMALMALSNLDARADQLVNNRLTWILRTQNDDGGWGYFGFSSAEETAFCLEGLLWWDMHVRPIDPEVISAAGQYLKTHLSDKTYDAMWICKVLFNPRNVTQSSIFSALYSYVNWEKQKR